MGELGAEMVIRRNDEITPGRGRSAAARPHPHLARPLHPAGSRHLDRLLQHFARWPERRPRVPILGVCLGHQAIGAAFGGNVVRAQKLMHGKTSHVDHDGKTIFAGLPQTMTCTRYHSLIVAEEALPEELEVSARTADRRRPSWPCATASCPSKACSSTPNPSSPATAAAHRELPEDVTREPHDPSAPAAVLAKLTLPTSSLSPHPRLLPRAARPGASVGTVSTLDATRHHAGLLAVANGRTASPANSTVIAGSHCAESRSRAAARPSARPARCTLAGSPDSLAIGARPRRRSRSAPKPPPPTPS